MPTQLVVVAQDHDTWTEAEEGLHDYGSLLAVVKVNSLAIRFGAEDAVRRHSLHGLLTMHDAKYHDTDKTMRRSTREATLSGASIITVHASAGEEGLDAAISGVQDALKIRPDLPKPWLVGVTVLTSFDETVCESVFGEGRQTKVDEFVSWLSTRDIDGVVCSAHESARVKSKRNNSHLRVLTAAVRPEHDIEPDEQANAVTPRIAREEGADLYIVGRGIIRAKRFGLTGKEALIRVGEEIAQFN